MVYLIDFTSESQQTMKEIYYLLGVIPAFFYGPQIHPYGFQVISFLLCLPLLNFVYQLFFSEIRYKLEVDEEYLKHKRRTGDAPPPFPNGWFKIAYSFEVETKKAIYVEALGEHFVIFEIDTVEVFTS